MFVVVCKCGQRLEIACQHKLVDARHVCFFVCKVGRVCVNVLSVKEIFSFQDVRNHFSFLTDANILLSIKAREFVMA